MGCINVRERGVVKFYDTIGRVGELNCKRVFEVAGY